MCTYVHEGAFVSLIIFRCLVFWEEALTQLTLVFLLVAWETLACTKPIEVSSRYSVFYCTTSCLGLGEK